MIVRLIIIMISLSFFFENAFAQIIPGQYEQEAPSISLPIKENLRSSALVGEFQSGPFYTPFEVSSFAQFQKVFGDLSSDSSYAVYSFFQNHGKKLTIVRTEYRSGLCFDHDVELALDKISNLGLLSFPEMRSTALLPDRLIKEVQAYAVKRNAMVIIDMDKNIKSPTEVKRWLLDNHINVKQFTAYYPYLTITDPLTQKLKTIPNSGAMLGLYAQNDTLFGFWKAPAGSRLVLSISSLSSDSSGRDFCNSLAPVNCLKYQKNIGYFPYGARTLSDDPEYKYIPTLRLINQVKMDLLTGLAWVVFEPNDQRLWGTIKMKIEEYLTTLWRKGALVGAKAQEAFYAKCDRETNPEQTKTIAVVGVSALRPAEFLNFYLPFYRTP